VYVRTIIIKINDVMCVGIW